MSLAEVSAVIEAALEGFGNWLAYDAPWWLALLVIVGPFVVLGTAFTLWANRIDSRNLG